MDWAGWLLVVVENGAARHTLTMLLFVQIASGSALVFCGFGYALRIRVLWLRLWAFDLYRSGKQLRMQVCAIVWDRAAFGKAGRKSREKSGSIFCMARVKELEARMWEKCLFSL